jgi:hypothetical protein
MLLGDSAEVSTLREQYENCLQARSADSAAVDCPRLTGLIQWLASAAFRFSGEVISDERGGGVAGGEFWMAQ